MTLFLATLITSAILLVLGGLLLVSSPAIVAMLKRFPRSRTGAVVFFGGGAALFVYQVSGMSTADVIGFSTPTPFVFIFGALALLSFYYVPEFLAVRGVSVTILVGAWPMLMAAYGLYDIPQRLFMVSALYLAILVAIYLAASPFRLRDFFEWLFARPQRSRILGGLFASYGVLLAVVAASY